MVDITLKCTIYIVNTLDTIDQNDKILDITIPKILKIVFKRDTKFFYNDISSLIHQSLQITNRVN